VEGPSLSWWKCNIDGAAKGVPRPTVCGSFFRTMQQFLISLESIHPFILNLWELIAVDFAFDGGCHSLD